jgi:glycosyltransferase involved in cell wall biosynthesis
VNIGVLNWRDLRNPDAGGAETFVHEVGRRWAADGHDVTLYASTVVGSPPLEVVEGMRIVRTGSLRAGTHHLRAPRTARGAGHDVLLESINTIPYMLPWRRGRMPPFLPLVHQLAVDVWRSHLPGALAGPARAIEPRLYFPYRRVHCAAVSRSTGDDLGAAGVRDVTVVPQGGIGPQPSRAKESDPTLLFVGRLAANKRPDHALEAFRSLHRSHPSARLWMIGDGPMRELLEARLPQGAELLGRVQRAELLERMGRAHVLLVTSIREGWGLVVTEANASGTPAVAYDVPGLRDSVRHGETGILVQPGPGHAAAAIGELLDDEVRYHRLQAEALGWGAACTWDRTAEALLGLLQTCVERAAISPTGSDG